MKSSWKLSNVLVYIIIMYAVSSVFSECYLNHDFNRFFQWSYGVTVWELMTLGLEPYYDVQVDNMPLYLSHGHRLTPPYGCPRELWVCSFLCDFNIGLWHFKRFILYCAHSTKNLLKPVPMPKLIYIIADLTVHNTHYDRLMTQKTFISGHLRPHVMLIFSYYHSAIGTRSV